MNPQQPKHNISYTFHVQSPEDFYAQLYAWTDQHYPETKPEDLTLARQLLNSIGVRCE
jgi:hypothetical protein